MSHILLPSVGRFPFLLPISQAGKNEQLILHLVADRMPGLWKEEKREGPRVCRGGGACEDQGLGTTLSAVEGGAHKQGFCKGQG